MRSLLVQPLIDLVCFMGLNLDMTLTIKDLDEIEERLQEVFITKEDFTEYKSQLFNKLDKIVKNTANTNTETELIVSRVAKIEKRLQMAR